jgi:sugar lactone lactonase YvrE
VAALELTAAATTFVNDVAVTREAAWFTDSFAPFLYRVALSPAGRPRGQAGVRRVPLTGDIDYGSGFNANGIDATPDGRTLVIVQSNTGKLFTVTRAGVTRHLDLAGATVPNGDGILLDGRRLYVVQNRLNRIAVVALSRDLRRGRVARRITSGDFDVPTTVDDVGSRLYAVNARFGATMTPTTRYWVTQLRK